jgi:hypothetical protein
MLHCKTKSKNAEYRKTFTGKGVANVTYYSAPYDNSGGQGLPEIKHPH